MSLYNLEKIFEPTSIAVVGASDRPGSIGRSLLENLKAGGFAGRVYPINPKKNEILGQKAYPNLSAVGEPIDLAVIVIAIKFAPMVVEECARLGIGGVIIISGGGKEAGEEGERIEVEILAKAREGGVRIVGPNCVGIVSSPAKMNASFAHIMPRPGSLAFVSQSGATCTAVLDYAHTQKIGFSHFVSIGSMLDADFGDVIDYLGNDPNTSAILLYVESVTNHRKFMSAARAVSRIKPIVLLKVGRSQAGAKAAMSHTGSLAGADDVYDEAFKRAGLVRVDTVEDLFDCAELMAKQPRPKGPGLAIVSNAGGPGVMAADYLALNGIEPAEIRPETMKKLDEFLPPMWSRSNPLDILGDASPETFRKTAEICAEAEEFDALLIMTTPQAQFPSTEKALELCKAMKKARFPVFTSWVGGQEVLESREIFRKNGIPTYETPERAVRAFLYMYSYDQNLKALREVPPKLSKKLLFDWEWADAIIRKTLSENRQLLTETESKNLLESYGIPVTPTRKAGTAKEASIQAEQMGYPVVLKLDSLDITHKTDAGGVKLDLRNSKEVAAAFDEIMKNAKRYDPDARVSGVTVQPMVSKKGVEIILGAKQDPDFGPVILFGMGGVAAEVMKDRAIGLPPLNRLLAKRIIDRTKVSRLLKGYRGYGTNMELLEEVLVRLSQLLIDFPEIYELDVNPMLAFKEGSLGLDARVIVKPALKPSPMHLTISPYPNQYETHSTTDAGLKLFLRPVKPEDSPAMERLFQAFSPRSIFWRFGKRLDSMPPELLARYTQIDYDRELAVVALDETHDENFIYGAGRVIGHPDSTEVEIGLSVGDPWQGKGVGTAILEKLVEVARDRGFKTAYGEVHEDNKAMLKALEKYSCTFEPLEKGNMRVTLSLE